MERRLLLVQGAERVPPELIDMLRPHGSHASIDWRACTPEALTLDGVDVILLVVPATPGFCEWLRTNRSTLTLPLLAVILDDVHGALRAIVERVDDFVLWPARVAECAERLRRLSRTATDEADQVLDRLRQEHCLNCLVGSAPEFVRVLSRIPLLARSGSPVLITGETGTGKELAARALHHLGPRHARPFVPVDCAAIPEPLFENELFGHARGAFTDAKGDHRGLVAMADSGTLFLDEVDALPAPAQAKLLRLLQEKTFRPLGSSRAMQADINVIAATNRDLSAMVREGRFRADLFFRINVLSLHMLPLRARRLDVPVLARHFIRQASRERKTTAAVLSEPAVRKLQGYDWPGNVRELHNVMQRALAVAPCGVIGTAEISFGATDEPEAPAAESWPYRRARANAVESFERQFVEDLLRRHGGNVTHAAREAQKDRRAFGRLIKKHGIRKTGS